MMQTPGRFITFLPRVSNLFLSRSKYSSPVRHIPVLLQEVLTHLKPQPSGVYADCTFGDGGYTKAILDLCDCTVVAFDQDPVAYAKAVMLAEEKMYRGRLFPIHGRFGDLRSQVEAHLKWGLPCFDGMVFDIGVSSAQLFDPARGFSYTLDGPLDMRMFSSPSFPQSDDSLVRRPITAGQIVNFFSLDQLANIIHKYGGDHQARKIATSIVHARHKSPITTTLQLAEIINSALPGASWKRYGDDISRNGAARTFQALRIFVNDELEQLKAALDATEELLKPGGRLGVVTFHSLEDHIVKKFLAQRSGKIRVDDSDSTTNEFLIKRRHHREKMKQEQIFRKQEEYNMGRGIVEEDNIEEDDVVLSSSTRPSVGQTAMSSATPSFKLINKKVIRVSEEEFMINPRSRSAKLRFAEKIEIDPVPI